jgi:hypothetical protein
VHVQRRGGRRDVAVGVEPGPQRRDRTRARRRRQLAERAEAGADEVCGEPPVGHEQQVEQVLVGPREPGRAQPAGRVQRPGGGRPRR